MGEVHCVGTVAIDSDTMTTINQKAGLVSSAPFLRDMYEVQEQLKCGADR
jgi:hypothetical protein